MELKKGDIFCTRNPMALGMAINAMQKLWSKDNESTYSHAGIIVEGGSSEEAVTFEALWTNKRQNLYDAYRGKKVLIGRNVHMTDELFQKGWEGVKHHEGQVYAGYRLPLFFVPFLAKYLSLGLGVCSELAMKFLYKADLSDAWRGWNPDDVADMIHNYKDYCIIFEGVL